MHCPNCDYASFSVTAPCPRCKFQGDGAQVTALAHLRWVLADMADWEPDLLSPAERDKLRAHYEARAQALETALNLREPDPAPASIPAPTPTDEAETPQTEALRLDIQHRLHLLNLVSQWLLAEKIRQPAAEALLNSLQNQLDDLQSELGETLSLRPPETETEATAQTAFVQEAVQYLADEAAFTSPAAQADIEAAVGLTSTQPPPSDSQTEPAPSPSPTEPTPAEPESPVTPKPQPEPQPAPTPAEPPEPAIPWRDRLWQSLLSERTLQAILFLGIFLLFAAAISFVVWGWQDFSAPLRIAIPIGFTAVFFAMGRYIRLKTHLYRSGLALSAIAALLIPIDFYTLYINLNFPPATRPTFWLIASLLSLAMYTAATYLIRSRIFGYLVGTAAGSSALALLEILNQTLGLSLDWRSAVLSSVALALLGVAYRLEQTEHKTPQPAKATAGPMTAPHPWRTAFTEPFRYLALLTAATVMALSLGWRYVVLEGYGVFHFSMALSWAMGGLMFGWAAVRYESRSLGWLTALSWPVAVFTAQDALFALTPLSTDWHSFGLAWLIPLYVGVGWQLRRYFAPADALRRDLGRVALGWAGVLMIVLALWSLNTAFIASEGAAALTYAVLALSLLLIVRLWRRADYLYGVALFSTLSLTFGLSALGVSGGDLSPGWALLALIFVAIALRLGRPAEPDKHRFAPPLVRSAFLLSAASLLPPLLIFEPTLAAYAWGHWVGLSLWAAWLSHHRQPGFVMAWFEADAVSPALSSVNLFQWAATLSLPLWLWLVFRAVRPVDVSFYAAWLVLAWGMLAFSYRLRQQNYHHPWQVAGLSVSVVALVLAWLLAPGGFTPPFLLILTAGLWLVDGAVSRRRWQFLLAGLGLPLGSLILLDRLPLNADLTFITATFPAVYLLLGLLVEYRYTRRGFDGHFLNPLYLAAHLWVALLLVVIYEPLASRVFFETAWPFSRRLWDGSIQVMWGVAYGAFAWGRYQRVWAHGAAWFGLGGGAFMATAFSQGRGASAVEAAVVGAVFVLAERGLNHFWRHRAPAHSPRRWRAKGRLAWQLYKEPLLVAGWSATAAAVLLAVFRNLWLLGGGDIQRFWAWVALSLVVGLLAISARLFGGLGYVWLATLLSFTPWTILTSLGWYTGLNPTLPSYAVSWVVLAGVWFGVHLLVRRWASRAYSRPLIILSQILLPAALLWGVADPVTSRLSVGLAIGLYGLAAGLLIWRSRTAPDEYSLVQQTKFLYPTLGLFPVWALYGLNGLLPLARSEHYGLLLLIFGPLGLLTGPLLKRLVSDSADSRSQRAYAWPAYLTGLVSLGVGTVLVAHLPGLLTLVLLFDALVLVWATAEIQRTAYLYVAGALWPLALWLALQETTWRVLAVNGESVNWTGWWLAGLAAVYFGGAVALRRRAAFSLAQPFLLWGFVLLALSLPPSSQSQEAAVWGFGAVAVLYGAMAAVLRQPILLFAAHAVGLVPLAVILLRSNLAAQWYGLVLLAVAAILLALGWGLDERLGRWNDFPWRRVLRWPQAMTERLLGWWALPSYVTAFGVAALAPAFTANQAGPRALTFAGAGLIFGWGVFYFRRRGWLLAGVVYAQLAVPQAYLAWGWWQGDASDWLRLVPLTWLTVGVAWAVARRFEEGHPLQPGAFWTGWSRPLYAVALADLLITQAMVLSSATPAGAAVTASNALLLALLASLWRVSSLSYPALLFGTGAVVQWAASLGGDIRRLPPLLAGLSLGYGVVGYGLTLARRRWAARRPVPPYLALWEHPAQRAGVSLSVITILLTLILGLNVGWWTARAIFGLPFREAVSLPTVNMVMWVLALLGLLYVLLGAVRRRRRVSYFALAMLLSSWFLYAFYVQVWDNLARLQWYALPAGVYLLGVSYFEWAEGRKTLARWLDYAGLTLLLATLFWQTLALGWWYFLLLIGEGLLAMWWGSARRLRRFLYAGMVAVVLATVGQLINALSSINQWLVFGLIGLLLVMGAILVERKMEELRAWQATLEEWE